MEMFLGWDTLLVTIVGMLVVFLGLVLLIILINIMGKLTGGMGKKKEAPKASAPANAPAAPVVESPVKPEAEIRPAQIDGETLAVLTAAIAATRGEGYPFKIRRVVRVNR